MVTLGCTEEKRHINILGLVDYLDGNVRWAHARHSGDRAGRFEIEELGSHPERIEEVIGEIVRHKTILYG